MLEFTAETKIETWASSSPPVTLMVTQPKEEMGGNISMDHLGNSGPPASCSFSARDGCGFNEVWG